jgi:hypothetical protein
LKSIALQITFKNSITIDHQITVDNHIDHEDSHKPVHPKMASSVSEVPSDAATAVAVQPWVARRTGVDFMEDVRITFPIGLKDRRRGGPKVAWIKIPTSFMELMSIFSNPKYVAPLWYRIPGVMDFPEFSAYRWSHNRVAPSPSSMSSALHADQKLFCSIVRSACRCGKPPVCSPDYFYYSSEGKNTELREMFARRTMLPGEWNVATGSEPEKHGDWALLGEYVAENVTTGAFLSEPPKVWDWRWFARLVMETKVGDNIPVRRDIVDLVSGMALPIEFPRRKGPLFRRKWTAGDLAAIREAAELYWLDWRATMEAAVGGKEVDEEAVREEPAGED